MNQPKSVSVNELLEVFRNASIDLVPWVERVGIRWKDGESYDDWDNITEALYTSIVCSTLLGEVADDYDMARYGFRCDDYSKTNHILVRSRSAKEVEMAFIGYSSIAHPMDAIRVAVLSRDGKSIAEQILQHENLDFIFIQFHSNGSRDAIDEVDIDG